MAPPNGYIMTPLSRHPAEVLKQELARMPEPERMRRIKKLLDSDSPLERVAARAALTAPSPRAGQASPRLPR